MKTIKKSIFAVILYSLMAFPGCQVVGIDSIEDNPYAGDKTVTITANIAGSTDTKVSLTPDTDAEGHPIVKVDWNESGEKFYVLGKTIEEFTQVSGNVFEGVLPEPDEYGEYWAIYYNVEADPDFNYYYHNQTGTLDEKYVYMVAIFDAQFESITFEHMTYIMKTAFKYNGNTLQNITSVKIDAYDVTGDFELSLTPAEGKDCFDDDIYVHVPCSTYVQIDDRIAFKVVADGKEYEGKVPVPDEFYFELGKLYTATVNLTQKESQPSEVILSQSGAANCYIISQAGSYKFSTVKGNSSTSVGAVNYAEVLWESFGTATVPAVGDLVNNVSYSDGYISFTATEAEGNAVIAAKSDNGTPDDTSDDVILWSWHIWLTDQPQGQVYYNNAGTMMDRNLGAISATPGEVGALGLLYQWGRKDPFLGSSSISENTLAQSTITWPTVVESNSNYGTIAYATANPTTFITYHWSNHDWYYTGSSSTDNTRWTESSKSIYDPCPSGWRVPDGGDDGVWSKALGSSSANYDKTNKGINFSDKFGSDQTIWYPASGCLGYYNDGSLSFVASIGHYWSASPVINGNYSSSRTNAYYLYIHTNGANTSGYMERARGHSVRCIKIDNIIQ